MHTPLIIASSPFTILHTFMHFICDIVRPNQYNDHKQAYLSYNLMMNFSQNMGISFPLSSSLFALETPMLHYFLICPPIFKPIIYGERLAKKRQACKNILGINPKIRIFLTVSLCYWIKCLFAYSCNHWLHMAMDFHCCSKTIKRLHCI